MAVGNDAGGDKGGILAQTRRVRWVLTTMTITLLVSWTCFVFLLHLKEKNSDTGRVMDQVTTAYTLTNIASEIRLKNTDGALRQCEAAIESCVESSHNYPAPAPEYATAARSFLSGVKTYSAITHALSPQVARWLEDVPALDLAKGGHCQAGICRLAREQAASEGKADAK